MKDIVNREEEYYRSLHIGSDEIIETTSGPDVNTIEFSSYQDVDLIDCIYASIRITDSQAESLKENGIASKVSYIDEYDRDAGTKWKVNLVFNVELQYKEEALDYHPETDGAEDGDIDVTEEYIEENVDWITISESQNEVFVDVPTTGELTLFESDDEINRKLQNNKNYRVIITVDKDISLLQTSVATRGGEYTLTKNSEGDFIILDSNNVIRCFIDNDNPNDRVLTTSDVQPNIRTMQIPNQTIESGDTVRSSYFVPNGFLFSLDRLVKNFTGTNPSAIQARLRVEESDEVIAESNERQYDNLSKSIGPCNIILELENTGDSAHTVGGVADFRMYNQQNYEG